MTTPEFARLETPDIRTAWPDEARNFTPWLLENLDRLSEAIGIPLEAEGSEVAVESFSADILARNPQDDTLVLIENQLECSDHTHLGQILTYLAGLEAKTIIWVASDFRDAHLSAVDWLNKYTEEQFAFFAVKVKVVRIGESPLAPLFDVVTRPNDWERRLQAAARQTGTLSPHGQRKLEFWTRYLERHPDEQALSGGAGGAHSRWRTLQDLDLVISLYIAKKHVGLFIRGRPKTPPEEVMERLTPHLDDLTEGIGLKARVSSRGYLGSRHDGDPFDPAQRDAIIDWLFDAANRFQKALYSILGETD